MDTVFIFLIETPWYVYLILVYLIKIGVRSVKGGEVSLGKFYILPIVFLVMSIDEFVGTVHFSFPHVLIWLAGIVIGSYLLGWMPYRRLGITANKEKKILFIPGSYFTLVLIIVTFAVKYYIGYTVAVSQSLSSGFIMGLLILSGLFTGAFVGRLLYVLKVINQA